MYQMISSTCSLEGKTYSSFGIRYDNVSIEDISSNEAAVSALVALCNYEALDIRHLPDVVNDFLTEPDMLKIFLSIPRPVRYQSVV